ncbi:MAG: TadE/TadG family type IV pilus assembly protein [Methylovirgula sp.]
MAQIPKTRVSPRLSGSAAIEYGLILPVLLVFTLGIMDMGRLFWTFITLNRATDAAARCGAVNSMTCATTNAIQTYAVAQAWGLTIAPSSFIVTKPACGVQVKVTYTFQFVIPWLGAVHPFGNTNAMTLNATACYPAQFP